MKEAFTGRNLVFQNTTPIGRRQNMTKHEYV